MSIQFDDVNGRIFACRGRCDVAEVSKGRVRILRAESYTVKELRRLANKAEAMEKSEQSEDELEREAGK